MSANAILGALSGGAGGISPSSSASVGATSIGQEDNDSNVFNFGGGGIGKDSVMYLAIGAGVLALAWLYTKR